MAIQRQVTRIRSADLTDPGTARQATTDAQFLIAALWLLRRAGCIAAANEAPPGGPLTFAIVLFDAALPGLTELYQVGFGVPESQGASCEDTATASPTDVTPTPIVEAISHHHYQWAKHTIDFDAASTASEQLTLEIHAALVRLHEQ